MFYSFPGPAARQRVAVYTPHPSEASRGGVLGAVGRNTCAIKLFFYVRVHSAVRKRRTPSVNYRAVLPPRPLSGPSIDPYGPPPPP